MFGDKIRDIAGEPARNHSAGKLMKQVHHQAQAFLTFEQLGAFMTPGSMTQSTSTMEARGITTTTTTTTLTKVSAHGSSQFKSTATQTGKVTSSDVENDSLWLTPITVGTRGQIFQLDCDTGSSDFWILSQSVLPAPPGSATHTYYNANSSSTSKSMNGYSWSISYGDGTSASGNVCTDNINVAGLIITNQAVEYATKCSKSFLSTPGDGICASGSLAVNF
jgi:Eukaryotic aspartyl protease